MIFERSQTSLYYDSQISEISTLSNEYSISRRPLKTMHLIYIKIENSARFTRLRNHHVFLEKKKTKRKVRYSWWFCNEM